MHSLFSLFPPLPPPFPLFGAEGEGGPALCMHNELSGASFPFYDFAGYNKLSFIRVKLQMVFCSRPAKSNFKVQFLLNSIFLYLNLCLLYYFLTFISLYTLFYFPILTSYPSPSQGGINEKGGG